MTLPAGGALVHLAVSEPLPIEAAAGDELTLTVRASCAAGCDRTGMAITISALDGVIATSVLATHKDGVGETAGIVLKASPQVGEQVLRVVLAAHEIAGTRYCEAALDLPMRVRPQATSLAVWGVPSPVVAGRRFTVQVGAKSTANAALAGRAIEICDHAGAVAARGNLGDATLAGTGGLYWTEIGLTAPEQTGATTWSVRFEASELDLPHDSASTQFSIAVAPAPRHVLSVKVVEQATAAPVADAELRLVESSLGAYRGTTGPSGLAEIALPKGRYELNVWKAGYQAPPRPVEVETDAFVQIEALLVPEEDPDARWKM